MANVYHIRIHSPVESKVLQHMNDYYTDCKKLIVEEKADTDSRHYHILLHTDDKINTVRERLRRSDMELNGNKDYSVKNVISRGGTLEGAQNYVCKDLDMDNPSGFIHIAGYTIEDLQEYHRRYWETRKVIREQKVKLEKERYEKKKPLVTTLVETYRCICRNISQEDKYYPCEKCIRTHVVRGYRKMLKGIDAGLYKRAYCAVMNQHYHDYFLEVYVPNHF